MSKLTVHSLIALILAVNLSLLPAAQPVIGVAMANGEFTVNSARVQSNATVFEGSTIETRAVSSKLELDSGARVQLGADSKGHIYRDRMVLERGVGQFDSGRNYEVQAGLLRVAPTDPNSTATVAFRDAGVVQVAALHGSVRVMDPRGLLVANIAAGEALDFNMQGAGAAAPSTLTGCLQKLSGAYLLRDDTANVTWELRGENLDEHISHRIQVTGSIVPNVAAVSPATQVIQVTSLNLVSKYCDKKPAAAVIAGIFVAATAVVVGVCLAGACGGKGPNVSPER